MIFIYSTFHENERDRFLDSIDSSYILEYRAAISAYFLRGLESTKSHGPPSAFDYAYKWTSKTRLLVSFTSNASFFFPFIRHIFHLPCHWSKLSCKQASNFSQIRQLLRSTKIGYRGHRESEMASYWQAECVRTHSGGESTAISCQYKRIHEISRWDSGEKPSKKCRQRRTLPFPTNATIRKNGDEGRFHVPRMVTRSYKRKTRNVSLISEEATPFPRKYQSPLALCFPASNSSSRSSRRWYF